jgi:chromatin segregation and condensation protein Rec8/ScpA/Scc1 (kleisin family)
MEIKSAMLLPRQEQPAESADGRSAAAELADPRYELVQQLLEYKKLKDSAALLDRRGLEHAARFPRIPARLDGNDEPAAGGPGRSAGLGPAGDIRTAAEGSRRSQNRAITR